MISSVSGFPVIWHVEREVGHLVVLLLQVRRLIYGKVDCARLGYSSTTTCGGVSFAVGCSLSNPRRSRSAGRRRSSCSRRTGFSFSLA